MGLDAVLPGGLQLSAASMVAVAIAMGTMDRDGIAAAGRCSVAESYSCTIPGAAGL